ncbi:hypothetical protein AYO47_07000 [Planctomyces sp. SCGC AG-212-M04]|nr:hypothetical protein AYO47_07000 [Planctomyces sp. SCGC AG-212-M04]
MIDAALELERYQSSVMRIGEDVRVYLMRYPRTLFCRITSIEVSGRTGRLSVQRSFDAVANGWNTKTFAGPEDVRRFVRGVLANSEALIGS